MTTLYKIIREDWTDCYSGTVKYTVGETVTVDDPDGPEVLCGKGLHACHRPENCLEYSNGNWPLRLLEVETDSIIAQGKIKCRCKSLTVKRELPISLCFGPNGEAVVRFLEEIGQVKWFKPQRDCRDEVAGLVKEHLTRLEPFGGKVLPIRFVDTWSAAEAAARSVAWSGVASAARLVAWSEARSVARSSARSAATSVARSEARSAAWSAAESATRWLAWVTAASAAGLAAESASWIVSQDVLAPKLNPFEPLFEVFKLGAWPIGEVDGEFVVFLPKEVRR